MAYFSFFWKKHYSDIGNCCMTKPLDETTVPGTNGSRLVSYIDVSWMSDIKLKWIGWDKGGDFAWITPDGMIYRFTDLKRNERGIKYEKEVQKLELWSGGWGTDGPPENLYEWELSVQENCGFCKSTPGGKKGEKEEKEDETGDKESDKDSGVNVRDWKEFADSKPEDENNDITRTSETTNTEHVTNTGKTAYDDALENAKGGGGGKKGADDNDDEDKFMAKLPYKDLIKLPAKPEDDDEPIYRKIPQFNKPKYQNPVLDNKKVLDNQKVTENKKVTDTSKTLKLPFKVPRKAATIDKLYVKEPIKRLDSRVKYNKNDTQKFGVSIMGNSPREEIDLPRISKDGKLLYADFAELMEFLGIRKIGWSEPNFDPKNPDIQETVEFINTLSDYFKDIKNARKEEALNTPIESKSNKDNIPYYELTNSGSRIVFKGNSFPFDTLTFAKMVDDSMIALGFSQKERIQRLKAWHLIK